MSNETRNTYIPGHALIARERERQKAEEGWDDEHDDEHDSAELAWAAVCYAAPRPVYRERRETDQIRFADPWPWGQGWDKRPRKVLSPELDPHPNVVDRIRCLVKAGALIAAEIDRLERSRP